MTEHIAKINEQLRTLGLGYMIEEGRVRRTIHIAFEGYGHWKTLSFRGWRRKIKKEVLQEKE